MKKISTLLFVMLITALTENVFSQSCVPDHPGYTTVPDSGILLPSVLPNAEVGVYYEQPITIGVPDSVSGYPLVWIQYNSLTNYLAGNSWTIVDDAGGTNYQQWGPLTWQCATIIGTPTEAGIDSIIIYVNATVSILGFPFTQNNTKAFALPLIVDAATSITDDSKVATKLLESFPNPFQEITSIGVYTGKTESATLSVFSTLGQLVYSETKIMVPGENYFVFNGRSLNNGTYMYTVVTNEKTFNKKLIKTE